jgi:GNAT superfamily N-acetyltransferase
MIQTLDKADLRRTRRLGSMFASEVNLAGGYNPDAFEPVWGALMDSGAAKLFYAEDSVGEMTGFLGAVFSPDLYSGLPTAQMQFFYIDPEHRKSSVAARLFDAFEKEAEKLGVKKYFVGHKLAFHSESMQNFFTRRGYVAGELTYWKDKI